MTSIAVFFLSREKSVFASIPSKRQKTDSTVGCQCRAMLKHSKRSASRAGDASVFILFFFRPLLLLVLCCRELTFVNPVVVTKGKIKCANAAPYSDACTYRRASVPRNVERPSGILRNAYTYTRLALLLDFQTRHMFQHIGMNLSFL